MKPNVRRKMEWRVPAAAVDPTNPYHTLYMRGSELSEGLMKEALRFLDTHRVPAQSLAFGGLCGAVAGLNNEAAKLAAQLEEVRQVFPDLYALFERAWAAQAEE